MVGKVEVVVELGDWYGICILDVYVGVDDLYVRFCVVWLCGFCVEGVL